MTGYHDILGNFFKKQVWIQTSFLNNTICIYWKVLTTKELVITDRSFNMKTLDLISIYSVPGEQV